MVEIISLIIDSSNSECDNNAIKLLLLATKSLLLAIFVIQKCDFI